MSARRNVAPTGLADRLLSAQAVRLHCQALMARAQAGLARHFTWHPERMALVSAYVTQVIRERHPDLRVPRHSRWRHFAAGNVDRWAQVASRHGLDRPAMRLERARARVDLAVISVLLDASAGAAWGYADLSTGQQLAGAEGLGVASLHWWAGGALSSDPHHPCRADAVGLERLPTADLALAFQVNEHNVLPGLEGRANLLRQLALALRSHPDVYGHPEASGLRPGHLVDTLLRRSPTGCVHAEAVLRLLLTTLGGIWPERPALDGVPLGDCWPHPDVPGGWVPLHQLSQWMTYALVEPLEEAGLTVVGLDELTALPDCRNGGLLLDLGLLQARDRAFHTTRWRADAEPIVEWRALTVVIMDHLAEAVRGELRLTPEQLPLSRVLEGGSWAAGRRIAQAKRPGGPPPVHIDSDGTVF